MTRPTSSPWTTDRRPATGRLACLLTAVLAAVSVAPPFAVAGEAVGVASKKHDGEKPGKGIGRGNGNGVGNGGRAVPEAPAPAPTVAAPAPPAAPKPRPTPKQESRPKPAPAQTPRPEPTQGPRPAPTEEPARAQSPKPKPKPVPTQAAPQPPRVVPQLPEARPGRPPAPAPVPTRDSPDDRASGESRDGGTGIDRTPLPGSGDSAPTPVTPGAGAPAPDRGARAPAPRVTGGLVDMADRADGNGGGGRRAVSAPGPSRSSGGGTSVTYRQDSSGRRVYAVPTPGATRRREVSVPGGVFGVLPSAAIEATSEVRGAMAEGGTRRPASPEAPSEASGVGGTISQPLLAIDEATGVNIPAPLAIAVVAAMALAIGLSVRRRLHRW